MKTLARAEDRAEWVTRFGWPAGQERGPWGRASVGGMVFHLLEAFRRAQGRGGPATIAGPLPAPVLKFVARRVPIRWPQDVEIAPKVESGRPDMAPGKILQGCEQVPAALERFCAFENTRPRPAFGAMKPHNWIRRGCLHMDHHLRQFGQERMAEGKVIPHDDEAIVLRTWPFGEADLLISLFTREGGRVKGVARHAMKSRKRFGGALEPATHARAHFTERPRQDLVRMDSFEILWSPLTAPVDVLRVAGMQLVVEVLEEAMPEGAPEDAVFRLALAVLRAMEGVSGTRVPPARDGKKGKSSTDFRSSGVWLPVTYFCLWMNRLMGWWPELGHCAVCGLDLRASGEGDGRVWWSPAGDGVTCHDDRRPVSRALSAGSVAESYVMVRTPLAQMLGEDAWPQERAADLRAFAVGMLERHLERRLRSAAGLV